MDWRDHRNACIQSFGFFALVGDGYIMRAPPSPNVRVFLKFTGQNNSDEEQMLNALGVKF